MIAVRVLRDGAVVRESLFPRLPVTLGRDPAADVVLFDDTVSPAHAVIEHDVERGLIVRDLGSHNGLFVGPQRQPDAVIVGSLRFRLGTAEIEVERLSDAPTRELGPAERPRAEKRRTVLHQLGYLLLATAGFCAGNLLDPAFWSPWEKERTLTVAGKALVFVIGVVLASFVLLVLLKAAGRRVRMADTLQATARVVWLWPAVALVSLCAYYVTGVRGHALLREVVLPCAAVSIGAAYLAGLRRPGGSMRFRLVWAVVVAAACVGLSATERFTQRKTGAPAVDYTVQPPIGTATGPALTLDGFVQRLDDTAASAKDDAARVLEEDEDAEPSPSPSPSRR